MAHLDSEAGRPLSLYENDEEVIKYRESLPIDLSKRQRKKLIRAFIWNRKREFQKEEKRKRKAELVRLYSFNLFYC